MPGKGDGSAQRGRSMYGVLQAAENRVVIKRVLKEVSEVRFSKQVAKRK